MNREEQLIAENGVLKERLYACHALGLPEVTAALAGHLDVMDVDVYEHRARLQGALTQKEGDLRTAESEIQAMQSSLQDATDRRKRMEALARELWARLHDPEKEPFPLDDPVVPIVLGPAED